MGRYDPWGVLNIVNGDGDSWTTLWPNLAAPVRLRVPGDQFSRPAANAVYQGGPRQQFLTRLPSRKAWLKRCVTKGIVENRIDLTKWAQHPAWKNVYEREVLVEKAFEGCTFAFANFVLGRNVVQCMAKARKLGWTGHQDAYACVPGAR